MMYEEDRENRNNSEAGYNDRNDEHMEYRSNESRNTETQEVRREQHFAAESGQSSSETWRSAAGESSQGSGDNGAWQKAAGVNAQTSQGSTWQSASQGGSQSNSTWQSAAQNESQGTNAWQSAPQNSSQGSTASWNAQASAQGRRPAGRFPEPGTSIIQPEAGLGAGRNFLMSPIRNRNMQNAADAAWQEKLPVLPQQPFCLAPLPEVRCLR